MKTQTLTKEEAIQAMVDGKQVTSDEFTYPDETYCYYYADGKKNPFRKHLASVNGSTDKAMNEWYIETWRLRKFTPEDKELVWCWNKGFETSCVLSYYDAIGDRIFTLCGERNGDYFENYAPFNGTPPPNICKPEDLED